MILLGGNKITESMITVTGGNTSLAGDRCINQTANEVTKFTDIVIDFGSAVDIDSIAVVNVSQDVTIEGNATDVWTAPSYSASLTELTGSRVRLELPTTKSYRYWRLVQPSAIVSYVGYFYLGEKLELTGRTYGQNQSLIYVDTLTGLVSGGSLVKQSYTMKELTAQFPTMSNTEYQAIRDYYATYGRLPAIIVPYSDDDQSTLPEFQLPFFCTPEFEFGTRSENNNNIIKAKFKEIK